MGAQKKFRPNYPLEKNNEASRGEDKKLIKLYIQRIAKLLEDTTNQKKAAQILGQLINKK